MKQPEQIELSNEEFNSLRARVNQKLLLDSDYANLDKALIWFQWIGIALQHSKISLNKLRKMFGIIGKKKKQKSKHSTTTGKNERADQPAPGVSDELPTSEDIPISDNVENMPVTQGKIKGHGRMGVDSYPDATVIHCKHILQPGDPCPFDCGGKLYSLDAGAVIVIKGQPLAEVIRYNFEKLRCNLCLAVVSAELPEEAKIGKYDAYFMAATAVSKYWLGVPYYRQEKYFAMQGVPLSDATQWDLVERLAGSVYPVFNAVKVLAAQGVISHADDTYVKILSVIKENEFKKKNERTGMYTTCILSKVDGHSLYLYFSGTRHAGENMTSVLQHRSPDLPSMIYMVDALSANIPKDLKVILCNCLAHGVRKFSEIEEYFPEECKTVLDALVKVYEFDDVTIKQGLSVQARLKFHQENSKPVLDDLRVWLGKQIDENLVEPNSHLGRAIKYLRKHWDALTRFLTVEGAPLDNNVVERALKIAIRVRKNAYFFKTPYSAQIGSMLTSMIVTCIEAGGNPIRYLADLHKHKDDVLKNPHHWLPWNYRENLNKIPPPVEQAA